jgi:hypothetical protein
MLNLDWSIARFILHPPLWAPGEIEADHEVVQAVTDPSEPERVDTLQRWLRRCVALLSLNDAESSRICEVILHFSDALPRPERKLVPEEILVHFENLETQLRAVVPPSEDDFLLTTLTSKALWCCFPEDVPIFDRHVRCALTTLARLMDVDPSHDGTEYDRFVDLWLRIYERVEGRFDDPEAIERYGSDVRFFNRYLRFLSDPDLWSTEEAGGILPARKTTLTVN